MAISQVFNFVGQTLSVADTMDRLVAHFKRINPADPYVMRKAAGAIGGAMNSGFLTFNNGNYTRV